MAREYYSIRTNPSGNQGFDIQSLRSLILDEFNNFKLKNYFQEFFGYKCVDCGFVPGRFGSEEMISKKVILKLKKDLWPFEVSLEKINQEEIFDVIEFLFDFISAPIEGRGWFHNYMECGWHYEDLDHDFEKEKGQKEFREEINEILQSYSSGYFLTKFGEIVPIADKGLETIFDKEVPFSQENLSNRLEHAISLFRSRHSNLDQRRDALKNLADILEPLRDKAKLVLTTKDENELFSIINNFGIRHNDIHQKNEYDKSIFFSWLFYYYLASIHACQRLINRKNENTQFEQK